MEESRRRVGGGLLEQPAQLAGVAWVLGAEGLEVRSIATAGDVFFEEQASLLQR